MINKKKQKLKPVTILADNDVHFLISTWVWKTTIRCKKNEIQLF